MRPAETFKLGRLGIEPTPTQHNDPSGTGFRFHTPHGILAYTSDTEMKPDIVSAHRGARVLIMSVTRPRNAGIPHHMASEDAVKFLSEVKPELAILTHMGMKFINADPHVQAAWIEDQSGVKTVPAHDGMLVGLEQEISIRKF